MSVQRRSELSLEQSTRITGPVLFAYQVELPSATTSMSFLSIE